MNAMHPMPSTRPAGFRTQRGFSFFEVLVAALVLGIGVMGFAGLQVRALDSTGTAHMRAQAAVLAAELAERIRIADIGAQTLPVGEAGRDINNEYYLAASWPADPASLPSGPVTGWAFGGETCAATEATQGTCNQKELINADVVEMRVLAGQVLPAGNIAVRSCDADGDGDLVCVVVGWRGAVAEDDGSADSCDLADPGDNCLVVQVYL